MKIARPAFKLDLSGIQSRFTDARIWFPQEPEGMVAREMRIASDLYRQTMTLLVLPPEVKPWERDKTDDDDDGLENTFDRFVRNGQPPVR